MKAVVQNLESGQLLLEEVPPPSLKPEGILVRVRRSLISLGTERAVIALANKSSLGKAKDRPDLARKVINKARQEGYWNTYKVVKNLIGSPIPLGYSCAGEVLEVGREVTEFHAGDRVACAGLNYANHAEVNYIPRNLAVKIPGDLSFDEASFVTVGAIAIQGVRLARIELGERVVVIGLGLVGQITAQLARCAGAHVIATDTDPGKIETARLLGARTVCSQENLGSVVAESTAGYGADVVLICAATKSDRPVRQAAEICRLKGRVVIVGDVGMNIERRPYYDKEIELVISRSYGPGRYDPQYEERGIDYPLAYVRWTEARNMASFLDLAARGEIRLEPLITHRFPIEQAKLAYDIVTGKTKQPAVAMILEYQPDAPQPKRIERATRTLKPSKHSDIRLGVIGAGQFAKAVLLPAFASHNAVRFTGFCTSSGFTSKAIADKYGASFCTSDPLEVIHDEKVNAVLIATRHNQHAPLAIEAIQSGKAVFLEKPLALTSDSIAALCQAVEAAENPFILVGYNRRFAPLAVQCREFFNHCQESLFVSYRVNAGQFPANSWVFDSVEGGGRILGEVCHFVDLISYLTGSLPARIFAEEIEIPGPSPLTRDCVTITLTMRNHSVGTIHYLTNGDTSVPKEFMEMFGGQQTAILDNYRSLALHKGNKRKRRWLLNQAKGHEQEVAAFVDCLTRGLPCPIDWETQIAVAQSTIMIHESLDIGRPVEYRAPVTDP